MVTLSLAVAAGYGTHKKDVSDANFDQVMKVRDAFDSLAAG